MTTIILNNIPEKLSCGKTSIDFDVFLIELFEYMQDLEDVKLVKNEIKNDDGYRISFDNYIKNV